MSKRVERPDQLLDSVLFASVSGKSHKSDLKDALATVDLIIESLLAGTPSRHMMLLLADFLEQHAQDFARDQLGASLIGRPATTVESEIAGSTFKVALQCGLSEAQALVMTYDAYHHAKSKRSDSPIRTHAADSRKPAARGKYQSDRTSADNTMDDTIRPLLKEQGFSISIRKSSGRPPTKSTRIARKKVRPE